MGNKGTKERQENKKQGLKKLEDDYRSRRGRNTKQKFPEMSFKHLYLGIFALVMEMLCVKSVRIA